MLSANEKDTTLNKKLVLGTFALVAVAIAAYAYLITSNPLRYASSPIKTSLCFRGKMNADKRTWKGNARGMTFWWWAVPSKFGKTEQKGFDDMEELKTEVDKYKQPIEELTFEFGRYKNGRRSDCDAIFAWQFFFIGVLFYSHEAPVISELPGEDVYRLPLKLANTHTDIFPIFGPTRDEYTTAWFAAYDLFGYPRADPRGEPLYPNRDWLLSRHHNGIAHLVGGAVAGAVLAPVLLSAAGFTAAGVTAGSVAAGVQSAVYGGATTGFFSLLQSAGTGAVGSLMTVMGGAAAVGSGVAAGGVMSDSAVKKETNDDSSRQ